MTDDRSKVENEKASMELYFQLSRRVYLFMSYKYRENEWPWEVIEKAIVSLTVQYINSKHEKLNSTIPQKEDELKVLEDKVRTFLKQVEAQTKS